MRRRSCACRFQSRMRLRHRRTGAPTRRGMRGSVHGALILARLCSITSRCSRRMDLGLGRQTTVSVRLVHIERELPARSPGKIRMVSRSRLGLTLSVMIPTYIRGADEKAAAWRAIPRADPLLERHRTADGQPAGYSATSSRLRKACWPGRPSPSNGISVPRKVCWLRDGAAAPTGFFSSFRPRSRRA